MGVINIQYWMKVIPSNFKKELLCSTNKLIQIYFNWPLKLSLKSVQLISALLKLFLMPIFFMTLHTFSFNDSLSLHSLFELRHGLKL